MALEAHRGTVTLEGARKNYGVVVDQADFSVDQAATDALRVEMKAAKPSDITDKLFDRGGHIS